MNPNQKSNSKSKLSAEKCSAVEVELDKLLSSEPFAGSPRLQAFLSYVVKETLEGRGNEIRGKSVAVDVYGRKLEGEAGLNLVRVEARRLRRLLAEYYETDGEDAPLRISIASGGYRPQFEFFEGTAAVEELTSTQMEPTRPFSRPVWMLIVGGLAIAAAVAIFAVATSQLAPPQDVPNDPERVALRERSVPALQAKNIADQARGMLFPVFDLKRQELALGMFQHAIDLDPALPDGHAGYAQTLAVIGLFTPDAELAGDRLEGSLVAAHKALEIAPTDAWSNGAMSFVLAVSQDYPAAIKHARIARDLSDDDGHVLDLVGMAAIVANDATLAAEVSDPDRAREGDGRFGSRNIWAVSQLMLGNYPETVEAFKGAAAAGAPVSPPSLLFQAVAHQQMSQPEKSKALLVELKATWPNFPAEFIVDAMFADGSEVENIVLKTLAEY